MTVENVVHIDGSEITTEEALIEAICEPLNIRELLGAEYGRNWDALDDSLEEIETPTRVVLHDSAVYADADPGGFTSLRKIFEEHDAPLTLELR